MSVCLSVCLSATISSEPYARSLRIFVHAAYGRGSVVLRRRCDTLCTSGFVDDVMLFLQWAVTPCSGMKFAKDPFRSNLHIYRKVGHDSIPYY